MYLQRNLEQTESTFLSYCLSDEKVALTGKIKMASGTDVSSFLSLPISPLRHPWDTDTHLEGIVNGIDTVPGWIRNELCCCDVNTKWPEPSCIYLDLLWSPPPHLPTVDLFTLFYVFLPSANQYYLQVYRLVHAQPQQLEYQTDPPDNTRQIFNTSLKLLSSFSKETRLFLSCKDGVSYIAAVQSFSFFLFFCNQCGWLDTKKRSDTLNMNCSMDTGYVKGVGGGSTGSLIVSGRQRFAESLVMCAHLY